MTISISAQKSILRRQVLDLRNAARATFGDDAERRLAENVIDALPLVGDKAIAVYWPIKSEIGVETLLEGLHAAGAHCFLPVVERADCPLIFRAWTPVQELVEGAHGVLIPPGSAPVGIPEIVIVPLVAFDDKGRRLGYGGGYYDRTLEILRRNGDILALGVAFSCQQVETVPSESSDQVLDAVATEAGVTAFTPVGKANLKEVHG